MAKLQLDLEIEIMLLGYLIGFLIYEFYRNNTPTDIFNTAGRQEITPNTRTLNAQAQPRTYRPMVSAQTSSDTNALHINTCPQHSGNSTNLVDTRRARQARARRARRARQRSEQNFITGVQISQDLPPPYAASTPTGQ